MMTMMSESGRNPSVQVPPWSPFEDSAAAGVGYSLPVSGVSGSGGSGDCSPYLLGEAALAALQRYLPCNGADDEAMAGEEAEEDLNAPVDAYSCDEFRMYEFKVRRCARGRSHDWTECPYAHPGEKARRRDPRKYHYSGTACPDFRKGSCKRGDACEFAHGVFECWLHPARYRTQPCKDGTACRRRVCFFAHTPEQLRVLPQQQQQQQQQGSPKAAATSVIESYDGSPLRQQAVESYMAAKNHQLRGHGHSHLMSSSPTSTLISPPLSPPSESPPVSPNGVVSPAALSRSPWPAQSSAVNDIVASLRQLQLCKANSVPSSWALPLGSSCSSGFPSPRSAVGSPAGIGFRGGFCSLPGTPTRTSAAMTAGGLGGWFDGLDGVPEQEAPVERVESGRALRAKMFERLSKESITEKPGTVPATPAPDVAWVSDLVM